LWEVTGGAVFLPDLNKRRHDQAHMMLSSTIKVESEVLVEKRYPLEFFLSKLVWEGLEYILLLESVN
jgi:hypothetical protein